MDTPDKKGMPDMKRKERTMNLIMAVMEKRANMNLWGYDAYVSIAGGMKVSEISKELGEGYKIVENRLYIARKAIRKRLLAVGF